jgi:hypothetical protein
MVYAAVPKIRYPYMFLSAVYDYRMVPLHAGLAVAIALPWAELLTGICLLGGIFLDGAFTIAATLFVVFVFVNATAIARGLTISCGCFSTGEATDDRVSYFTLLRSMAMLAGIVAAYALASRAVYVKEATHGIK